MEDSHGGGPITSRMQLNLEMRQCPWMKLNQIQILIGKSCMLCPKKGPDIFLLYSIKLLSHIYILIFIYGSVFFMFGLIMAVAGVVGLTFGSGLSYWLRPKYRGVDPLICGGGLVPSSILILVSFIVAYDNIWAAYILVFFGQVFLNMNWAVIVDMTLVSY